MMLLLLREEDSLRALAFTAALVALVIAAVFAFEAKAGPPWGPETPH